MDVFLLPLERWAKELKAQRESDLDSSDGDDSNSADKWAPDFTQDGAVCKILPLSRPSDLLREIKPAHLCPTPALIVKRPRVLVNNSPANYDTIL